MLKMSAYARGTFMLQIKRNISVTSYNAIWQIISETSPIPYANIFACYGIH